MRLLDAADRPSGALRDRLIDKGYDDETVAAVVDRLIEVGLVMMSRTRNPPCATASAV